MKTKILLIIVMALISLNTTGQGMPGYDNTNVLTLGKSLIESAKQTSQLLKTVKFLQEQEGRLEQVGNVVKEVKAVQEIVDKNRELFNSVQHDLSEILNSPYIRPDEIDRISESFNSIIEMAMEDMDFMQQLLTSNLLNMTDAERLAVLEVQKERSREMRAEIELRYKRYRAIISIREMQDRITNREINY